MTTRIGIIGIGAMGRAIATGLRHAGWSKDDIVGAVRSERTLERVSAQTDITLTLDPREAVQSVDVVVLAVKPRDVDAVVGAIASEITSDHLVISVAAGVTIARLQRAFGSAPVIRAMPNTPALVGEGVTGVAIGDHATDAHVALATEVMGAIGSVQRLEESVMDAVTAVSGTGPAYVFLLAEALIEAAIREGMSREVAETFVHGTIRGAGHLLTETDLTAAELRAQVTSPGGTTAAAVHVLENRGFRALVEDAVRAAAERSRELGEQDRP